MASEFYNDLFQNLRETETSQAQTKMDLGRRWSTAVQSARYISKSRLIFSENIAHIPPLAGNQFC